MSSSRIAGSRPEVATSNGERRMLAIVAAILATYPPAFRTSFGVEIRQLVGLLWREPRSSQHRRRLFFRTVSDLLRQAMAQWAALVGEWMHAAGASRVASITFQWAETWTLVTSSLVWVAFIGSIASGTFAWGLFGAAGTGTGGAFVALSFLTLFAVAILVAKMLRHDRARSGLMAVWLGFWALGIAQGIALLGEDAVLQLDSWGIRIPLLWLLVPNLIFTLASLVRLLSPPIPGMIRRPDRRPDPKRQRVICAICGAIAVLLTPVQLTLFALGDEAQVLLRIAILITVAQWIVLWIGAGDSGTRDRSAPLPPKRKEALRIDANAPLLFEVPK